MSACKEWHTHLYKGGNHTQQPCAERCLCVRRHARSVVAKVPGEVKEAGDWR